MVSIKGITCLEAAVWSRKSTGSIGNWGDWAPVWPHHLLTMDSGHVDLQESGPFIWKSKIRVFAFPPSQGRL
jgi:hypothetical protein